MNLNAFQASKCYNISVLNHCGVEPFNGSLIVAEAAGILLCDYVLLLFRSVTGFHSVTDWS